MRDSESRRPDFAEWQSGCGVDGLLDLGKNGERDGGRRVRAQVDARRRMKLRQPAFDAIGTWFELKQAGCLSQSFTRTALRTQHAGVGEWKFVRIAQERSQDARVLFETVCHQNRGVRGE